MKKATRQKKQLESVKKWLKKARPDIEERSLDGWKPEFSLLIAMEQLVKYLEQEKLDEV